MSTDSTELTFVRCPSCRSLVPAVSTRCRMCGATLDASSVKQDEGINQDKRSGRVRQHTMSASSSELNAAAGQIRKENTSPTQTPDDAGNFGAAEESEELLGDDNPLGEYMDDLEGSPTDKNVPDMSHLSSAPTEQGYSMEDSASSPIVEPSPPKEEPRPRVTVETGGRTQGRSSGLSFSRPRESQPTQQHSSEKHNPERHSSDRNVVDQRRSSDREQRRSQDNIKFQKPHGSRPDQNQDRQHNNERPRNNERQASQERVERREYQSREQQNRNPGMTGEHRSRQVQNESGAARVESTGVPGRLFGWLISYDNPNGQAIELREGKFFVSGSQIKKNDLVLDGKGVSSPHALVSAVGGQGLRIQDLMSDGGVFVKKRNSDSYRREDGAVTVGHGDWIKFGEVEFLVALVLNGD
jgi:FHA domain